MTASERTAWSKRVSLKNALDGSPPPAPRVGQWVDSDPKTGEPITRALFYPNEIHSVFGDPEAMKSWAMLLASAQEIDAGHCVFYVDMEANERSIVDRLQLLGAKRVAINKRFLYFRPDDQINEPDKRALRAMVAKHQPTLVVLDGVTEAFAVLGLSINSTEDTAIWFRNFARQFQVTPSDDYDGPAIVELDHVVKDREARNGWAIGSIHKKAGIKGAAYQVVAVHPLGKGKHGVSRLFLEKDSPGGVEWIPHGKHRQRLAAELHCDATADDGSVDAWFDSPDPTAPPVADDVAPSQAPEFQKFMRGAWRYVEANPGVSGKVIRSKVPGVADKTKQEAIAVLEADGHLINEGSPARANGSSGPSSSC